MIRTADRGLHGVGLPGWSAVRRTVELADPWHVVALIVGILGKRQTGCSSLALQSGAGGAEQENPGPGRVEPAEPVVRYAAYFAGRWVPLQSCRRVSAGHLRTRQAFPCCR